MSQDLEKLGHFVISSDFAQSCCQKQKSFFTSSQYIAADCRHKILRHKFDVVFEKGVIDALLADENPWSPSEKSQKMVTDMILAARDWFLHKKNPYLIFISKIWPLMFCFQP